jgi:peroxiredoxin
MNPKELGHGSVVIYLYPGSRVSPDDGDDTPMVDTVQHRAFRDHHDEIAVRRFDVAGISSQPRQTQYASANANHLTHTLLTDLECWLATDVATQTGIPKKTAYRYIRTIRTWAAVGLLELDATSRLYRLAEHVRDRISHSSVVPAVVAA